MDIQRRLSRNSLKPEFSAGLSASRRGSRRLSNAQDIVESSSLPVSRQISIISESDVAAIPGSSLRPGLRRMQTDVVTPRKFGSHSLFRVGSASFEQNEKSSKVASNTTMSKPTLLRGSTDELDEDLSSDDEDDDQDEVSKMVSAASIGSTLSQPFSIDDEFDNEANTRNDKWELPLASGQEGHATKGGHKARKVDREDLDDDTGDAQQFAIKNARRIKQLIQDVGDEQARCHERWLRRQAPRGELQNSSKANDKVAIEAKKSSAKLRRKRKVGILSRLKLKGVGGTEIRASSRLVASTTHSTLVSPESSESDESSLEDEPLDFTSQLEEQFAKRRNSTGPTGGRRASDSSCKRIQASERSPPETPAGFIGRRRSLEDVPSSKPMSDSPKAQCELEGAPDILASPRRSSLGQDCKNGSTRVVPRAPCFAIVDPVMETNTDIVIAAGKCYMPPALLDGNTWGAANYKKLPIPQADSNKRDSVRFDSAHRKQSQCSSDSVSDIESGGIVKRVSIPEVSITGFSSLREITPLPSGVKRSKLPEIPRLRNRFRDHRLILGDRWRQEVCTVKRSYLEYAEHLGLQEEDWSWMGCIYALDVAKLSEAAEMREKNGQNIAAAKLQEKWRSLLFYRSALHVRHNRRRALVKVQRWWRHKVNYTLPIKRRIESSPHRVAKLVHLQATVRGWLTRHHTKLKRDLHGVVHKMERLRLELGGEDMKQVVRLQALIRGHLARSRVQKLRLELEAALAAAEENRRLKLWKDRQQRCMQVPGVAIDNSLRMHMRSPGSNVSSQMPSPMTSPIPAARSICESEQARGSSRTGSDLSPARTTRTGSNLASPTSWNDECKDVKNQMLKDCQPTLSSLSVRPLRALVDTPMGFRLKQPLNPDIVCMGGLRKGYNCVASTVLKHAKKNLPKTVIKFGSFLTTEVERQFGSEGSEEKKHGKVVASLSYAIPSKRMQQGIVAARNLATEVSRNNTRVHLPKVAHPSGRTFGSQ